MNKKIKNIELVTIALYESGGASKCVDTEDIAVKADQIDDQRFKWRKQKYKKFIDRGLVVESLNAARVRKIGSFLEGNDNKGWILTSVGLEFCKKTKNQFGHTIRKKRLSKVEKNYLTREQIRIENSEAFLKFSKGEMKEINDIDLKNLFKIDDYTSKIDLEKRILHLLDNFKEKDRIFELINFYKKEVTKYVDR
tara:strand:+ start:987 stop:1571 length:585 start_codon:yes stop_codon:yes gene_type:complete